MKKISLIMKNDEGIEQTLNFDKVKTIDITDYTSSTDLIIVLSIGVDITFSLKEVNYKIIIEKSDEDE